MPRKSRKDEASSLGSATRDELLVMLAQELLARKDAGKEDKPKKQPVADWTKERRTCPKCGHEGPVDPDFGVKVRRGLVHAQSWCKKCRASTNYYHRPRRNRPGER